MNSSSPSRKIKVRNPSHFGSKSQPSPGGSSPTRFASIGSTGGLIGRSILRMLHRYRPSWPSRRSGQPVEHSTRVVRMFTPGPIFAAMANLRDQLTASLGGTYSIDRELGGGGMSRVFLAEETALGRKVVIKVLPPEMAGGINADR